MEPWTRWPATREELIATQEELAAATPPPWERRTGPLTLGGCFVCFERGAAGPGEPGDRGWAAAALVRDGSVIAGVAVDGAAPAGYEAGLLALREGPLLEAAVRALPSLPDVLLVDATGRDHPRRAGLALHLGAVLDVPTVGVTHRPLLATGPEPGPESRASTPLMLDGEVVGYWLRTRAGTRPLAVHAAWRTTAGVALDVVRVASGSARTPTPLREARRLARDARAFACP
jgi:deoxyribonuclease V